MDDELCFASAVELRDRLARRELSARELMEAMLDRVERVNPGVNAIVSLRAEQALAEAEATPAGPLHGVPVTIKDLIETADLPTTYGSCAFAGHQAGFDAVAVTRLREAGGIVIGKTNTSEFGLRPVTENLIFGATSTPWNLEYNSGGSSGGAAAAAAAGISPLALGSDGGGSCRIPSSCCEVVGLKPTRGRVPLAPASYEAWGAMVVNGPIARTVRDVALMLDVVAGPVVGEPYGVPRPERPFLEACERGSARPLRIGVLDHLPDVEVEREVLDGFHAALPALEGLGHELVEADPGLGGLRGAYWTVKYGNTAALLQSFVPPDRVGDLEENMREIAARGENVRAADYCLAIDFHRLEAARIMQAWTEIDALATPTLTKLPQRNGVVPAMTDFDERWKHCIDWHSFTLPFNITGQPALSVPAARSPEGLPIGMQLVGRAGDEATLLALAAAYEEARPWSGRRPEIGTAA